MLLAASGLLPERKNRTFSWQNNSPSSRKRRRSDDEPLNRIKKSRTVFRKNSLPSPVRKAPATLSVSKKRKRRCEISTSDSLVEKRKKQMVGFENGAGVASLGELEKTFRKNLTIGDKKESVTDTASMDIVGEQDTESACTALVPVEHRNFKRHLKDFFSAPTTFFTVQTNNPSSLPKRTLKNTVDPNTVSSSVLEVLMQLGFVEKVNCFGKPVYIVLKTRFEPIFTHPTSYYFQNVNKKLPSLEDRIKIQKKNKPVGTKTLVGLWLFLVKLGYFVPFPRVASYTHFFSPINETRLEKLGNAWLKQLGITEEMAKDPAMMDLILKKICLGITEGKKTLKNGDEMDEDEIMIEAVS